MTSLAAFLDAYVRDVLMLFVLLGLPAAVVFDLVNGDNLPS